MFELTRNFLRFYFPYHMNTVNREQELENLQKDHVIDELNQVEAELTQLRAEVERLKIITRKQEPMKPRYSIGKNFAWCPVCDEQLDLTYCINYCYDCGQKLDWGK